MATVKGVPGGVSRRERASRTRLRIAGAAADLFGSEGYAGTTIDAVAQRAGVAVQTVYFVFHTKPELLVETVRIAGGGPEGGSEVMARSWVQDVVAAPDGARRLALAMEHGSQIYRRLGPLWPAIQAALGEPEVREAWGGIVTGRREGMRRIVDLMASRGELRDGLDPSIAADILFGLHRHELYLAFTREAGWSFDRYRAWSYATLCDQLLPPEVARDAVREDAAAVAGLELARALPELWALSGLHERHVPGLLRAFDLGTEARLSDGPVASGRVGAIWRLDTDDGSWAVKEVGALRQGELLEITEGAAFQEAALVGGVPVPAVRRTVDGRLIADLGGARARVVGWVELRRPDIGLDAAEVGRLVARLHRVPFAGTVGPDPWYDAPVGKRRWSALVGRLRASGAPFATELAAVLPEILALEALLGTPPRSLRTCHRDLWADNLRRTEGGGLCVFDFDNAGLADPSRELAAVLVEYAGWDVARARELRGAYEAAGGPGRVETPADFSMVIAQLHHIVTEGCRRWLVSTTDEARADNEGWVREYLDRPLSRSQIEALLD